MSVGMVEFGAYERVRRSGLYNMFDPRAWQATGLTEEEFFEVLHRYTELRKAFEASAASKEA